MENYPPNNPYPGYPQPQYPVEPQQQYPSEPQQQYPFSPYPNNYGQQDQQYVATPKVGFGKAIGLYFSNMFNFSGRSRRSEYWYVVLFWGLLSILFAIAFMVYVIANLNSFHLADFNKMVKGACILSLVFSIMNMALIVRRLHDIGKSPVWLLLLWLPSVLYCVACFFLESNITESSLMSDNLLGYQHPLLTLLNLLVIASEVITLVFFVRDSQKGTNQYGPSPKYREGNANFYNR